MDQQSTDPNNPVPTQPVNPVSPPASSPREAGGPVASMWGNKPDLAASPAVPVSPAPVVEPVPTFVPPVPTIPPPPPPVASEPAVIPPQESSAVPSWAPVNDNTEAMPTDLSNLMSSTPPAPAETAQSTVVVPPSGAETNQVVTSGSKGLPKIVLILGAVLILIAVGASAYFILGIGNSSNLPTSVPAQQQTLTTPPKQIVPSVAPAVTGTGSATLGNPSGVLSGTPTPATTSGTSAIDVLRSRVTPTP